MSVESPNSSQARDSVHSFLAELLAEQSRLDTPVARFSRAHDAGSISQLSTLNSQLIPLTAPGSDEQYAFEVDLDACSGCKSCVTACHALNGLDDREAWRDVGLIVGGEAAAPYQQTITSACHHCADPGCLNGCPVLAYEKDGVTGIVRHLDDQCIGCQYCSLKCPYNVPKYNARLGIVRKCDMCHGRLSHGEAPACVQACPTHAIKIVTVKVDRAQRRAETGDFLRAAPSADYTQPTTRYVSRRPRPANARPSDEAVLRVQHAHTPLAIMLTLLPLAVGANACLAVGVGAADPSVIHYMTLGGWVAGAIGLGASVAHLGQPLRAWRIFLGWRRSWLSREALVFGAWFAVATAALRWPELHGAAAAVGLVGLVCSAMIYIDTRRVFWRATQTLPRFSGAVVALGAAVALAAGGGLGASAALILATLVKLALEWDVVASAEVSGRLLAGPLRGEFVARIALSVAGGIIWPVLATMGALPAGVRWLGLAVVVAGEFWERRLFFRAVDAPKMPGMPT